MCLENVTVFFSPCSFAKVNLMRKQCATSNLHGFLTFIPWIWFFSRSPYLTSLFFFIAGHRQTISRSLLTMAKQLSEFKIFFMSVWRQKSEPIVVHRRSRLRASYRPHRQTTVIQRLCSPHILLLTHVSIVLMVI